MKAALEAVAIVELCRGLQKVPETGEHRFGIRGEGQRSRKKRRSICLFTCSFGLILRGLLHGLVAKYVADFLCTVQENEEITAAEDYEQEV
jgi:hypothetical protein